jgi:LacI family transcriptional regulator
MGLTIKDVARYSKVSTATVSRVINNDPRVKRKTRENVLNCIELLDYKVNNIARSLKLNKTFTIGFVCPGLTNPFFMKVAQGIEEELKKHGYTIIICNSNESVIEEQERIRLLCEKCVDGVIVIPATAEGIHFNKLNEANIPVVLVDRLVDNFTTDAVLVDNTYGSYAAVEYIIRQGARRIGYIGGDLPITSAQERDLGYRSALADYGIPLEPEIIKYGDFHIQSGYTKMWELMEIEQPPGFVFISNNSMNLGAVKYLIENRATLRTQVRIASFDDIESPFIFGFCPVRVRQPMIEIGNKAAQIMLNKNNHEGISPPQVVRLKTELVIDM